MGKMKTKGLAQEEKNTGQNLIQKIRINFLLTMNILIENEIFIKNGIMRKPKCSCKKTCRISPSPNEKCCKRITFLLFLYYSSDEYCVRTGKFKLLC